MKRIVANMIIYTFYIQILLFIIACIFALANINLKNKNYQYIYEDMIIFSVLFIIIFAFVSHLGKLLYFLLFSIICIPSIIVYSMKYDNENTKDLEKEDSLTKLILFSFLLVSSFLFKIFMDKQKY